MRMEDWEARRGLVSDLIDVVEQWLSDRGFTAQDFPNSDRSDDPAGNDEAIIFGEDCDELEEGFMAVLDCHGLFPIQTDSNPEGR